MNINTDILNILIICSAKMKLENVFLSLIGSKQMETDKSAVPELREILYVSQKGTEKMRKAFESWNNEKIHRFDTLLIVD